jgi:hypothetical protein
MARLAKNISALTVLTLMAHFLATQSSSALTAELAKKCRAMAIKAHPTQLAGTKAKGVEKAQRDYFQECVTKDGKMENGNTEK